VTVVLLVFIFIVLLMQLYQLEKGARQMSVRDELDRLTAIVGNVEAKTDHLIEVCNEIAAAMRDSAANPAEIRALADRLEAQANEAGSAADANDPTP
jgi:hypothetical protein